MDAFIRFIADDLVLLVVLVGGITFFVAVKQDRYQRYVRAIMAGLTALVTAKLFSLFYTSTRPFTELGVDPKASYLNNPGFPSDHALFVTTITLVVWGATHRTKTSVLLAILSVGVCVGRVLALVHTPADVIGGVVAGFVGVALWYRKDLIRE